MSSSSSESAKKTSAADVIKEILNKDRLPYIRVIHDKKALTSLQVTREALALRRGVKPEQIDNKTVLTSNPNVNSRLKNLVDIGVLNQNDERYSLSSTGLVLLEELPSLMQNMDFLLGNKQFFDTHDCTVIPSQQFHKIYQLQFAEQCKDPVDYTNVLLSQPDPERRICMVTDRLHSIPGWIVQEICQGAVALELLYQFREPFKPNFNDEEERTLWRSIIEMDSPTVNVRYLILSERNQIEIRIIDDKWTILSLFNVIERTLDRQKSFYGADERFVGWVRDVFLELWNESNPLEKSQIVLET